MPQALKEDLRDGLQARAEALGEPGLLDRIADETIATESASLMEFLTRVGHPALTMEALF